jgi:hypothetical protein
MSLDTVITAVPSALSLASSKSLSPLASATGPDQVVPPLSDDHTHVIRSGKSSDDCTTSSAPSDGRRRMSAAPST